MITNGWAPNQSLGQLASAVEMPLPKPYSRPRQILYVKQGFTTVFFSSAAGLASMLKACANGGPAWPEPKAGWPVGEFMSLQIYE
jgi:hypothetical protein